VREFTQEGRGADDDVDTVDAWIASSTPSLAQKYTVRTSFDGDPGIVHVAADVGEDLGLESELADGLAVCAGLLRGGGGGEFNVLDPEGIEGLGDRDFSLGVEEGVGKLLALLQKPSISERD
jgi:hypothetical protein